MLKKLLLTALVVVCCSVVWGKTIILYHTSDVHGFFYPQQKVGGYASLAAVLKKEKNPFLLLDSGDFANGTIETKKTKGMSAVELMNGVGYDAATVGNHEFDFKDDGFAPLLKKANFAVLAANMREKASGKIPSFLKEYQVFQVGDAKVAVIGLANRHPTNPTKLYTFTKPLKALDNALKKAEQEKPDAVVVLVHDSLADYKNGILDYMGKIADKFQGRVHVVLGGHAHRIFQNEHIKDTLYVESGRYLKAVSKITLETNDETGKILFSFSELIPLEIEKTGEDAKIAALAASLREPGADEVIGHAGETLSKRPVKEGEKDSPLDDWISDTCRAYTQTDIFIHNTGGTRIAIEKGDVTRRTLIDLFPFEDKMVRMKVTGRTLKKFIREGLVPWNKYVYSGLQISYSVNKKGRVKDLHVLLNGRPLENQAEYVIAANSYVAKNNAFAKATDRQTVGTQSVRGLIEEAFANGVVFPPQTGRILQR
jgi:2',3'-cyclic-nucleotide 2'-phosphodiesterase (5'-nucleotidase family)